MLFIAPPAERRGSQSIAVRLADRSGADMSKLCKFVCPLYHDFPIKKCLEIKD